MSQHVKFELTLPLYITLTLKSADCFRYYTKFTGATAMVAEHRFKGQQGGYGGMEQHSPERKLLEERSLHRAVAGGVF